MELTTEALQLTIDLFIPNNNKSETTLHIYHGILKLKMLKRNIHVMSPLLVEFKFHLCFQNTKRVLAGKDLFTVFLFSIFQARKAPHMVYQYHFTDWPDHGVPNDAGAVLGLLNEIHSKHEHCGRNVPIVIHCR